MVSRSALKRLAAVEQSLRPEGSGDPLYVFVEVVDNRVRDPDSLEPLVHAERKLVGCRCQGTHFDRLPDESVDAMCMRAKLATGPREPGAVAVITGTYSDGCVDHLLAAASDPSTVDIRAPIVSALIQEMPD